MGQFFPEQAVGQLLDKLWISAKIRQTVVLMFGVTGFKG